VSFPMREKVPRLIHWHPAHLAYVVGIRSSDFKSHSYLDSPLNDLKSLTSKLEDSGPHVVGKFSCVELEQQAG
jgi:hypothetical protein